MSESFDCCSVGAEARALFRMVGAGNTIEELRGLIAVPSRIERVLRSYARMHAEDAHWVETTLKFRRSVAREFERPVREGVSVADVTEPEESELDTTEETYADAQR